jgi:hypothetical protein
VGDETQQAIQLLVIHSMISQSKLKKQKQKKMKQKRLFTHRFELWQSLLTTDDVDGDSPSLSMAAIKATYQRLTCLNQFRIAIDLHFTRDD